MHGNKTAKQTTGRQTDAITAVIFANSGGEAGKPGSSLFEVGTLPVLLRDFIALERAGAGRIIACVDPITGRRAQRALLATGRLPRSVEWREVHSATQLSSLLGQIASEPGTDLLMLVAGDTAYQPALFRQASEWTGSDSALVLTTNGEPIGISAFSSGFALDVAQSCPPRVHTLHELHEWLVSSNSARSESVQEESWQRVLTPEDGFAAERKLDRWLVKPTDGIFARMNRRVSVPISRQLIKFPITPNMVSVGTLGVGVASGFFFACGGYWNMLFGAVLSIAASILDGCDGEVARLKLMESAFGCWLETVCDYLYYLLVFAGMAVGLSRTYGSKAYLAWGAALLVGAVTSFLVAGLGRHRLAAEHPEQFLKIWQAKAESRRSNPILYIGRHTEFIIRRCFLPYALFFFALLNITRVAFLMSAVGANLVWMISLYSYCTFVVAGKSYLRSSAASA